MLKDEMKNPIPYFEIYVSFLSTMLAIILLKDSSFLDGNRTVYTIMSGIAAQVVWSMSFALAAMLNILGLAFKNYQMRKIGLAASVITYGALGYCYLYTGGYLGASAFVLSALFSFISVFNVSRTGLR